MILFILDIIVMVRVFLNFFKSWKVLMNVIFETSFKVEKYFWNKLYIFFLV